MAYNFLSGLGQVAHFGLLPEFLRTPSKERETKLLRAAHIMLSRFNGRFIPYGTDADDARVARILVPSTTVDISLLYDAYALSGDKKYFEAAQAHVMTTIEALVKSDGGVYACADPDAGIKCAVNANKILGKEPHKQEGTAYVRAASIGYVLWGLAIAYCRTRIDTYRDAFEKSAAYLRSQAVNGLPPFAYVAGPIADDAFAAALYANAFLQMAKCIPSYAEYGIWNVQELALGSIIPDGPGLVAGHCLDPDKPHASTMRADFAFLHALSLLGEEEWQRYVAGSNPPQFAGFVRESDHGLTEHPTRFRVITETDALRFRIETEVGAPPAVRHSKNAWENDAVELCIRAPGQDKYADLIVTLAHDGPQWSGWNSVDPHRWKGEWRSEVSLDGQLARVEIVLPHSLVGNHGEYEFDIRRLRPDETSALRPAPKLHDYRVSIGPPEFVKLTVL